MHIVERRFLALVIARFRRTDPATRRWLLARLSADDRELRGDERAAA